ncbi:MAG: bacteriophage Gp15 family protein [Lachnospiraceae bacterium]|nr:bacteriophage Gp15 family protein [Lachnospiraceae bacterium]
MIGALPEALTVGGAEYPIRTDYRNALQVFEAFQDPELTQEEKWIVAIYLLFEDFSCADDVLQAAQDGFDIGEAVKQISWFISAEQPEKEVLELPTYNWKQDEQMIFSAVNKVAGKETRELEYLHWWTFLGYFNEVGEGTFSFIVGIRHKLNKGKKLEKHEKEFLSHNKELVQLKKPKTKEEQEQEDAYKALLDEVLG